MKNIGRSRDCLLTPNPIVGPTPVGIISRIKLHAAELFWSEPLIWVILGMMSEPLMEVILRFSLNY